MKKINFKHEKLDKIKIILLCMIILLLSNIIIGSEISIFSGFRAMAAENPTEPVTEAATEAAMEPATITPEQPVLNSAVSTALDSITINWNAVSGVDGYRIYRKNTQNQWEMIAQLDSEKTTYTDTNLVGGIVYTYTVCSYVKHNETEELSTYDNNGISARTLVTNPGQPFLNFAKSTSYNSVTIKWGTVAGAEGYRVYRKTSGGTWKRIAQVNGTTTSYLDGKLTCGTTYIYTVRAYIRDDGKYILSSYNKKGISVKAVPAAPELTGVSSDTSSITVTWNKTAGATSYIVYRKTAGSGWKKIATMQKYATSYTDKKASKGVKYNYTVRAKYNSVMGSYDMNGLQSALKVAKVTLKSVSVSSDGTGRLEWEKQSGAEGYLVYRKEEGKSWTRIGTVSSAQTVFSESGLEAGKNYIYTVAGYMILNGKKYKGAYDSKGISPKLEYSGKYLRNITKTFLGTSGAGRKMYSYTIGTGNNHIVITMAIHGWEDVWARDGFTLVKTGEQLIEYAVDNLSVLNKKQYSIIIVPMANPDGLYDGRSHNGPGRCTTYRYNNAGKLVKGGVDLNRAFPAGFRARFNSRNYTGARSLMAKEAVILKNFVDSSKGSGKNIFIDGHGWLNQTITRTGNTTEGIYKAFKRYFPGTRPARHGGGVGYISGYASRMGYDSVLFEFPYVTSDALFTNRGYAGKFINSVFYMVKNIR